MIITFKQPKNNATKILNMEETTMKKFTKTIAAISAAAMLTISSGMTAFAYDPLNDDDVDKRWECEKVGRQYCYHVINYNTDASRGYSWDTEDRQKNLPRFTKEFLDTRDIFRLFVPTDNTKEHNKYGNGHMLGLIDPSIARTDTIANAKEYVDKLTIKDGKYGICLEYQNYTYNDIFRYDTEIPEEERIYDNVVDYGLRLLDEYHMNNDVLNKFKLGSVQKTSNGGLKGVLYLDNYYVANLWLGSDTNVKFDKPVLEPQPSGIGFRTKVTFTVTNPYKDRFITFGDSISGTVNYNLFSNLRFYYDCNNGANAIYSTNRFKTTVKLDKKNCSKLDSTYQGLVGDNGLVTEIEGEAKTKYKNHDFIGVKVVGSTMYIGLGAALDIPTKGFDGKYLTNEERFDRFMNKYGKSRLGKCDWVKNQLNKNVKNVVFYFDQYSGLPIEFSDYTCQAYELRNKLS